MTAVEVYGPPGEAGEVEQAARAGEACARGAQARASRCSAWTAPTGRCLKGSTAGELEDVFVLLTGEEIA